MTDPKMLTPAELHEIGLLAKTHELKVTNGDGVSLTFGMKVGNRPVVGALLEDRAALLGLLRQAKWALEQIAGKDGTGIPAFTPVEIANEALDRLSSTPEA